MVSEIIDWVRKPATLELINAEQNFTLSAIQIMERGKVRGVELIKFIRLSLAEDSI